MTALIFPPKPNRPGTLAVIKTDGTGYRELVQDDAQGTMFNEGNPFKLTGPGTHVICLLSSIRQMGGRVC